jgi:hypothetical protein
MGLVAPANNYNFLETSGGRRSPRRVKLRGALVSCCLPSAEFRVASASNCAASLARVLFAMSLRSPSGSRTRHIPGHSESGSTAESKRRPARRRSRSPCHIRQSLVGVFFTEGYASSPLRVRRTKTPDNDGLSCVPSPSNRARMQSTSPGEACGGFGSCFAFISLAATLYVAAGASFSEKALIKISY